MIYNIYISYSGYDKSLTGFLSVSCPSETSGPSVEGLVDPSTGDPTRSHTFCVRFRLRIRIRIRIRIQTRIRIRIRIQSCMYRQLATTTVHLASHKQRDWVEKACLPEGKRQSLVSLLYVYMGSGGIRGSRFGFFAGLSCFFIGIGFCKGSKLSQVPGPRSQVPGPRSQAPGPRPQAPGPRSQVPGPRSQAPGPRPQAPGSRLDG
jgi:hypothetical protein